LPAASRSARPVGRHPDRIQLALRVDVGLLGGDELDVRPDAVRVGVGKVRGELAQPDPLVLERTGVDLLPPGRVIPHRRHLLIRPDPGHLSFAAVSTAAN
jgi:hypothetical protein